MEKLTSDNVPNLDNDSKSSNLPSENISDARPEFKEGYLDAQLDIQIDAINFDQIKDYLIKFNSISIDSPIPGIDKINIFISPNNETLTIYVKYRNKYGVDEAITAYLNKDGELISDGWKRSGLSSAIGVDLSVIQNLIDFKKAIIQIIKSNVFVESIFNWQNDPTKGPDINHKTVVPKYGGIIDLRTEVLEEIFGDLVKKIELREYIDGLDCAYVGIDFIIFTSKLYSKGLYFLPIPNEFLEELSEETRASRPDIISGKGIDYKNIDMKIFMDLLEKIFPNKKGAIDIDMLQKEIDRQLNPSGVEINNVSDQYRINHPEHDVNHPAGRARFAKSLAKNLARHFGYNVGSLGNKIQNPKPTKPGLIMDDRRA